MKALSKVDFGPTDAATPDKYFLSKYVEENNFHILIDNEYTIITGEKGAGKTALIKGLRLKHGKDFSSIVDIRFGKVSFAPIIKNMQTIAKLSDVSDLVLITNYWKYSLLVEAMKTVFQKQKKQSSNVASKIRSYLVKKNHITESVWTRLANISFHIWQLIEEATRQSDSNNMPGTIPIGVLQHIESYPITDEYLEMEECFGRYLIENGLRILITLDGLDLFKIRTRKEYSQIVLIFEGLIAATYEITISDQFSESLLIKSLIPYDIYAGLELRDLDKYEERYKHIRWDYKSLQELLRKRIIHSLNLNRSTAFERAWSEILPSKVFNSHVGIEEDTYEYLLRHTLYRPRHLQVILKIMREHYPGMLVTSEMIPPVVAAATKKLVRYFISEYKDTHSKFGEFIKHFKGKSNIMNYGFFRSFVSKVLSDMKIYNINVDEKIDNLYKIGFIGLIHPLHTKEDKRGSLYRYAPPVRDGMKPYI